MRKTMAALITALTIAGIGLVGTGHANAAIFPSGYCLEDPGGNAGNGTPQDIYSCLSGNHANERWSFHFYSDGSFYLELASAAGHCLDLYGDSGGNGSKVDVWGCNGSHAQRWHTIDVSGTVWIAPIDWPACLEVHGGTYFNDAPVDIWACETPATHLNERWSEVPYGNTGQYFVEPASQGTITSPADASPQETPVTASP